MLVPAILRRPSNATADVAALSITAPNITTGNSKLLDWRVAKDDGPATYDCYKRAVKYCTVVHGTGASILLMGDSTARMWLPTFIEIAKRESLTLSIAADVGCPWQRSLVSGLRIPATCARTRDDWYDRVIPAIDPDVIFLSERGFDQPQSPMLVKLPSGKRVPVTSAAAEQVLVNASQQSVRQLRTNGRQIVFMRAIPLPPGERLNPLSCLSAGRKHCEFRVSTKRTGLDRYFAAADAQPDTRSIDLDRLVCPRLPVCDPVVNNIIVPARLHPPDRDVCNRDRALRCDAASLVRRPSRATPWRLTPTLVRRYRHDVASGAQSDQRHADAGAPHSMNRMTAREG